MTKILYGGSAAEFVVDEVTVNDATGTPVDVLKLNGSANLEAWTAGTSGSQITDLALFTGSYTTPGGAAPSGIFPADATGTFLVWAEDNLDYVFVTGQGMGGAGGRRWIVRPLNETARLRAIEAGAYVATASKGAANGVASLDGSGLVPTAQLPAGIVTGVSSVNGDTGAVLLTAADVDAIPAAAKSAAGGVAPLDSTGKVPAAFLPPASAGGVTSVNTKTGAVVLAAADVGAVATGAKGTANGVAALDANTKVPVAQLPVGTNPGTVMAGDRVLSLANMPAGHTHFQTWNGVGTTPNRDTNRTDIKVRWYSPVIPTIAAGKANAGDDWVNTAP